MTEPWPNYVTTATLGPQPGPAMCCDSCRIVARAVMRVATALEFYDTAAEVARLFESGADVCRFCGSESLRIVQLSGDGSGEVVYCHACYREYER